MSFTENILQRMFINPFYAITIASQFTQDHIPSISEKKWIQTNVSSIQNIGIEKWLTQLLDVLEGKLEAADKYTNPFDTINIDYTFAVEHPPIVSKEQWIHANAVLIKNMGTEKWLKQLLDVLAGDIVTATDIGLTPPEEHQTDDVQ